MPRWIPTLVVALSACLAGQTPPAPAPKSAFDPKTLETYLRHQFLIPAQYQVRVGEAKPAPVAGLLELTVLVTDGKNPQEVIFLVSKDGQKVIQGKVFDINQNPFRAELDLLKTEFEPSIGTPGATVVLVLFSDFQCAYCKEEAKSLRENLVKAYPKQVRLYFKDFPLEQLHAWAKTGAIAGRCVFRQDPSAFWDYHDWIFEHQGEITPENLKTKVLEWAERKGLDGLQLTRCLDTRATEADVNKSMAEGRALQLNSTPTLFINGRRMVGQIQWPQLKQVIDTEIEYQKTAKNAGEDCGCDLKLPIPTAAR
jgi:protein-disulfide isomerase